MFEIGFSILVIIAIDILLSGDNAVVIALASRGLPLSQRRQAILWGVAGAVILRLGMVFFAVQMLSLPYVKFVGAVLLLWIGIKMLLPERGEDEIDSNGHLFSAIKTIIVADVVMSLDNVVAVSAAANGNFWLVAFGISISIPMCIFGSQIVLKLMDKFPVLVSWGAMLIGWIAGGMIFSEPAFDSVFGDWPEYMGIVFSSAGSFITIMAGSLIAAYLDMRNERELNVARAEQRLRESRQSAFDQFKERQAKDYALTAQKAVANDRRARIIFPIQSDNVVRMKRQEEND